MTVVRSDVLVLGSSLGGLVAATYLARAGLRVVLLEEDCHAKRPPLLREPLLLSGLENDGNLGRVLSELSVPLVDRRELAQDEIGLQVLLPGQRIDVPADRDELARELSLHGLCAPGQAHDWLRRVDEAAESAALELWDPDSGGQGALTRHLPLRGPETPRPRAPLPPPPGRVGDFANAAVSALGGLLSPEAAPAPSLLLAGATRSTFRMPHAGVTLPDLFRRRLMDLHGEIRPVSEFLMASDGKEIGVELPRSRLFAGALLIAAPLEPLRRFLEEQGGAPNWLRESSAPVEAPLRLFRVERDALPIGMHSRVVVGAEQPEDAYWLACHPDPKEERIQWLCAGGPGAAGLAADHPLGHLAPFAGEAVPIDPGPAPRWDLDPDSMLLTQSGTQALRRAKAPVLSVGPEATAGTGLEGEVLLARAVALRIAARLESRKLAP
jgi:hypothetical protein